MSAITPESLMVSSKNRGGRPRVEEPRTRVSSWIPTHQLDAVIKLANSSGVSVSAFIGQLVEKEVSRR